MLNLKLKQALRLRGVENHQQFLRSLGFASSSITAFLRDTAAQIKYEQLEQLCIALNCTPNDLFEWQPNSNQQVAATHSINNLRKKDLTQLLGEVPMEKFDEIAEMLERMKSAPAE